MATAPWSRSLIVALLAPTSLLLSAPAFANDEAVKVSGKMWVSYSLDLTDSEAMANEFDVDRAYLTFKKNIGDNVTTRLTLDVGRDKDQTTSFVDSLGTEVELDTPQDPRLHAFVKYAYVGWKASDEVELRLGSAQTPYVSFAGKIWGHRFLSKVFIASVGLQGGADLGALSQERLAPPLAPHRADEVAERPRPIRDRPSRVFKRRAGAPALSGLARPHHG